MKDQPLEDDVAIDLASYREFENLVAEVRLGSAVTAVISKEPGETEFYVSFHAPTDSSSMASPSQPVRVQLSVAIEAIRRGASALES
jgi:hypothetical protein